MHPPPGAYIRPWECQLPQIILKMDIFSPGGELYPLARYAKNGIFPPWGGIKCCILAPLAKGYSMLTYQLEEYMGMKRGEVKKGSTQRVVNVRCTFI